jgi:NAD(P)-dependent dehydrogenase (short-subunit alcohol dehydrogenase family)
MSDVNGKVALVTGGASGLGAATCAALVRAGAQVVVADISPCDGDFVACDVRSLKDNQAAVDYCERTHGRLDLVHLNAGILPAMPFGDSFDVERYRLAMAVNVDGVVFGTQAAVPALRRAGGGAIVATASLAGLVALPLDPIYAATKHAVVGFTRAMGPVLAADGITFNAVCPGYAESPMLHSAPPGSVDPAVPIIPAETVADTVVRLFGSPGTGECWFVQPHREPAPFAFRNVPGPGVRPA